MTQRKPLHVIYVPGLGDHKVAGQLKAVSMWPRWGVTSELFQMNWADGEAFGPKFERLLARIDTAIADGKDVGLVGASAGGSAVINAFEARKEHVAGTVLIAGKVNRPGAVGQGYKQKNPAFWESINECQKALERLTAQDRQRILSRYGFLDEMVPAIDSYISGARNRIVPTIGHVFNIGSQMIVGAPSFIKFLKKQQTRG